MADAGCPNWETKALKLFEILEEYACAKDFFEPLAVTPFQQAAIKKFEKGGDNWRPGSLTEVKNRLERREIQDENQLYAEISNSLNSYIIAFIALKMQETIAQKAQAVLNFVDTLVVTNKIFDNLAGKNKESKEQE